MSSTHTPTVIELPMKAGKQTRITNFLPGTTCSPKPLLGQEVLISKLNITITTPLEIVWLLCRPLVPSGGIKKIIRCSFYSPRNSRKNKQLIDHISVTYNQLKIKHSEAATIISGDKNNLDETNILALNPDFRQKILEKAKH